MLERIGRYEVLELLAGGGQGTVYRARDSESGEVVALKVMHPGHTGEAQYLEALRREANLASRLEHPNVTRVLDYQVESGTAYVVMEYVPDVLSAHISPDSPMSPERVLQIARGICSALSHAHSLDVVHRDIKPQNILLTDDGTVKVNSESHGGVHHVPYRGDGDAFLYVPGAVGRREGGRPGGRLFPGDPLIRVAHRVSPLPGSGYG